MGNRVWVCGTGASMGIGYPGTDTGTNFLHGYGYGRMDIKLGSNGVLGSDHYNPSHQTYTQIRRAFTIFGPLLVELQ